MIGRLEGTLVQKHPPRLLVDVGGVGYELEAPMTTFYDLPPEGNAVTLFTHLLAREDGLSLYGFASEPERRLFRNLLRVQGVGARIALAILSNLSVEAFVRCVRHEDHATLAKVPGIGKKTASRLFLEMRDGIEGLISIPSVPLPGDAEEEAVSALIALGYNAKEASRMVAAVKGEGRRCEDLIRLALRRASA